MALSQRINPWREALDQALAELDQAEHAFQWADPDYCDYHIFRIQAAQEKVGLILRQARIAYGMASAPMLDPAQEPNAIALPEVNGEPSGSEAPTL
ncbi:MAG: hypothetical protein M1272_06975 [Firmicutes bacterium]|nr:hypothetical protein [Bacillota bacterium]